MKESKRPAAEIYYRHSLPVRIAHWVTVVTLPILLMSGLNIFNANSELHWGKSSYTGAPPLLEMTRGVTPSGDYVNITRILGRQFITKGSAGESGFPSWMTLPGIRWLSKARRWHFFFAWILVITGVSFVCYSFMSRHLQRDLLPTREELRNMGKAIKDHLLFRHPRGEEAKRYNVLQKLAYLSVIFLLLPLVIINGFGLSPALNALVPGWVDLFGGRQSMRTIHFIISWTLVAFAAVHVFQVIVSGFWNNFRSMITGNFHVPAEDEHEKG